MRRLPILTCLLVAAFPASAAAQAPSSLSRSLNAAMRSAGPSSGAQVVDAANGRVVYQLRATTPRVLASNTKLYTTAAALGRFGPTATLDTRVLASGGVSSGTVNGDLYLRGGGDPTFGSSAFARRAYGSGATVEALAAAVRQAGVTRVNGGVVGDEGLFDSRRGGPASGYRASIYVGPLSALAFNRGLASPSGRAFQSSPPAFAAAQLVAALRRAGVSVGGRGRAGRTPGGASEVAKVSSPSIARLASVANKPSDNFVAEILLKGLGARAGGGSTASGARQAAAFARGLGAPATLVDGSGLSRSNRASPRSVTRLLVRLRSAPQAQAFSDSLAVAGRDGTLARRMRSAPARGNCRGKTGTLAGVSTLSGYCRARSGRTLAFSILMNGVSPTGARALQDRMAQAIAGSG